MINSYIQEPQLKKDAIFLNLLLKSTSTHLFVNKTVSQLLKGYEDPLLIVGKILSNSVKDTKFGLMKVTKHHKLEP